MSPLTAKPRRAGALASVAALCVAAGFAGGTATAEAKVASCSPPRHPTTVGFILSVRNMSCRSARRYYQRHHGDQHVPISKGQVRYIGTFRCRVYKDLTPPGPSDTWVRIRCVRRGQAFRLEYGV